MDSLLTRLSPLVSEFKMFFDAQDKKQEILLLSDVHWDNPCCDRNFLLKHLNQARERNAKIISVGDFFCLMQGKYDPRKVKEDIRPEHNTNNYIQSVVLDAAEFLHPYSDLFLVLADGNHETSVKNKHEIDVLQWLTYELNREGANIQKNGLSRVCYVTDEIYKRKKQSITNIVFPSR